MVCTTYFYTYTADGKLLDGKIVSKSVKTLTIYKTVYNISSIFKWTRFDGSIVKPDKNKFFVRYYYKEGRLNGTRRFKDLRSEMNSCIPMILENQ